LKEFKKTLNDLQTDKRNALCYCRMKIHILLKNEGLTDFVYDEQYHFRMVYYHKKLGLL
jgi:hypothetical protein